MDVMSAFPEIQAALAGVVIAARMLLLLAIVRARVTYRSGEPTPADGGATPPGRSTRSMQVVVAASQAAGAVLTVATWLHSAGVF